MQRLIIILFLIIGIPIISNAASVYDDSLMNAEKEKQENIKTNKIYFLFDHPGKTMSAYEIELASILKKNTMAQKIQDKPVSYQQNNLIGAGDGGFIQVAFSGEIDVQALLETATDWREIKADLRDVSAFLDEFDRWTTVLFDEYLVENINTNLSLVNNIQTLGSQSNGNGQLKGKIRIQGKNRLSDMIHQNHAQMKGRDSYKISSSHNNEGHETYEDDDNKENILSIVYLWNMYSDTIILVSIIVASWLVITSLIKILTRNI